MKKIDNDNFWNTVSIYFTVERETVNILRNVVDIYIC